MESGLGASPRGFESRILRSLTSGSVERPGPVMLEGYDAGVSLRTVPDPDSDATHTVIANWTDGAWPLTRARDRDLLGW